LKTAVGQLETRELRPPPGYQGIVLLFRQISVQGHDAALEGRHLREQQQ